MSAPRVAIIIPAFNAADDIEASVRSILGQSVGDFLLLVVNDGSTDQTGEILARLAAEDARLVPITVANGGPARARNLALDWVPAGTEYLMFCDADDELAPDALAYALEKGGGADLVLMGFSIRNPDLSRSDYCEPEQRLTPETLGPALGRLYKANLLNQVWGKLYRAPLVLENGLRFLDYRWGEDRLFIYDCLEHAQSVAVLPDCKYTYVMHRGESLITRYYDKKPEVCLLSDKRMQELCRRFGVTEEGDFRYMFMKSIFSCLTTLYAPNCPLSGKEKRAEIRRIIRNEQVVSRSREVFGGPAVKLLCAVIRTGNVTLNALCFRLVAFAGKAAPRLFTKLKHKK